MSDNDDIVTVFDLLLMSYRLLDFSALKYEQQRRDRIQEDTTRAAASCDCWRVSGPLCARCKLAQAMKPDAERD